MPSGFRSARPASALPHVIVNSPPASHLFTLRIWGASQPGENGPMRMQVKHLMTGATHTFQQWSEVRRFIEAIVLEGEPDSPLPPFNPEPPE